MREECFVIFMFVILSVRISRLRLSKNTFELSMKLSKEAALPETMLFRGCQAFHIVLPFNDVGSVQASQTHCTNSFA